jgi:cyclohexyl-isocyanide hydratase
MFDKGYQDFFKKELKESHMDRFRLYGGFYRRAAAGLFNGFDGDDVKGVSTYWSQIPNLALLQDKFHFKVAKGFPRYTFRFQLKRFSGGGISSSVDLALKLVEVIKGKEVAEKNTVFIQYAPHPPTRSGDPDQAPETIVRELTAFEAEFTAAMKEAVERLLNNSSYTTLVHH